MEKNNGRGWYGVGRGATLSEDRTIQRRIPQRLPFRHGTLLQRGGDSNFRVGPRNRGPYQLGIVAAT
jgi:hypothetical protein